MLLPLKEIVEKLIETPINYFSARDAANKLYHYYNELAPIGNDFNKKDAHLQTDFGLAISKDAAAFCIIDFMRTRNFILAIKQAVEDKISQGNKPAVILYAGTGPFASLIIPLTTIFTSAQVQFVLLEINAESKANVEELIRRLKIENYIIDIVETDAATYCLAENIKVDILVSETMKPSLEKEPQVSIVANLVRQCKSDVIIIPQSIKVELAFTGKKSNKEFDYKTIETLLDFNKICAIQLANDKSKLPVFEEGIYIKINDKPNSFFKELCTLTHIILYKEITLGYHESSLTLPIKVFKIQDINFPVSYKVKYEICNHPKFSFENVDS